MELKLGDLVNIKIDTPHGLTIITGPVSGIGFAVTRPDAHWFEIAGMGATFYTDDEIEIKVVG